MARLETFTFRVDEAERNMIIGLSERLQRSQSDAVRWIIREAFQQLGESAKPQHEGKSDANTDTHS